MCAINCVLRLHAMARHAVEEMRLLLRAKTFGIPAKSAVGADDLFGGALGKSLTAGRGPAGFIPAHG